MASAPRGAQRASCSFIGRWRRLRLPSRVGPSAILAATLTLLVAAPMAAHDTSPAGASERIPRSLVRSLSPGDRLVDHGVGLDIPQPGQAVWAHMHYIDGTSQTLFARNRPSGEVAVRFWGDESAPATQPAPGADSAVASMRLAGEPTTVAPTGQAAGADVAGASAGGHSECSDDDYNTYSFRVPDYRWSYAADSTPSKFRQRSGGTGAVVDAIIRANSNITSARNNCGRSDRISATFEYQGTTSRRANIGSSGYCTNSDGKSVISWGDLPSYSAAMACMMRISGGVAHEADIKINWNKGYETNMSSCAGEFMIESAITHEMGHVYGLAHVSSYSSPNLTMNPYFGYCSMGHSSLGLGDMLGLERKY